jgi:hypothetical protein
MIYTRYGSKVAKFISRDTDDKGGVWITCQLEGMDGTREIHLSDFRADEGAKEVDEAIRNLPVIAKL